MKKLFFSSLVMMAFALVGCSGTSKAENGYDDVDFEAFVESDTIHFYDSIRIVEEYDDVYDVTFIVPKSKEVACDSIKAKIRSLMDTKEKDDYMKMAQEACKKFFDKHKEEIKTDGNDHNPYPWEFIATFEFSSQSQKFLTISYEEYDARGGVHGMPIIGGYTFLRENGYCLTWKDFTDNPEKLVPYIEEGFGADREIYMETIKAEEKELVPPESDPWIEGEHIIFQYGAYEIGPYAMGTPRSEVMIWDDGEKLPDDVIKPLIKELIDNYAAKSDCGCGDGEDECEIEDDMCEDLEYEPLYVSLVGSYKVNGTPNIKSFMEALPVYDEEMGRDREPDMDMANGYFHYFEEGAGSFELYGSYWNRKDGKKLFIVSYNRTDFYKHEGHTETFCLNGNSKFFYASANKFDAEVEKDEFIDCDTGFEAYLYNPDTKEIESLDEPPFNGWGVMKTNRLLILPKTGKDIKVRDGVSVSDKDDYTYHTLKWNGMTFDYVK